jgi:hypothetical protein
VTQWDTVGAPGVAIAGRVAIGLSSSYQQLPTEVATQPYRKLALHRPSRAVFQLFYDIDRLLQRAKFLRKPSDAPATEWKENKPEMHELVTQLVELYMHWGADRLPDDS